MTPKVSVNVCCYNSEKYLDQTLGSVWAQTYSDYELVVIDDGSTDRTDKMIRSYIAQGRKISYFPQANAGLGAARNAALKRSTGEFIAILDHDDVWEPAKLEKQMNLFTGPDVGFVGCDATFIDSHGNRTGRYSDGNPMHRGRVLRELFLYNFIPCAGVVLRRSAIEKARGFFRPEFRIAEEYELFLRLAEKFEYDFVPEALVRIRVHSKSAGWDVSRERDEMRRAYDEVLARNPVLGAELGASVVAIKRAGLWLTPAMVDALSGKPAPLGARAKASLLRALAAAGPRVTDPILGLKRGLKRFGTA